MPSPRRLFAWWCLIAGHDWAPWLADGDSWRCVRCGMPEGWKP